MYRLFLLCFLLCCIACNTKNKCSYYTVDDFDKLDLTYCKSGQYDKDIQYFGVRYNDKRRLAGIPVLPTYFQVWKDTDGDNVSFGNPGQEFTKPRYKMKMLKWSRDTLVSENTIFQNFDQQERLLGHLLCMYNREGTALQLRYKLTDSSGYEAWLEKTQFDSVLKAWHLYKEAYRE